MHSKWRKVSLGELAHISHGFAFSGEYFTSDSSKIVLLTPGNFKIGGGFKEDKPKGYAGPIPEEYILNPHDLIVTMTDLSRNADTLGYPALVPDESNRRFLHNQRIGKVHVLDPEITDPRFLYYLMCTTSYRNTIVGTATGSTVKHTAPSRILAFSFLLPSLNEQKSIVAILAALDERIDLLEKQSSICELIARAIFKSWFVDFDPVRAKAEGREPEGMDAATAALFPSGMENGVPDSYFTSQLGQECTIVMGQSPSGKTYNEDGEGLPFYQGRSDFSAIFPRRRVFCTAPTRLANQGDSLLSVRAPVGDVNIASEGCCIGRGIAALRHKSGSVTYTVNLLKSLKSRLDSYNNEGTVFGSIGGKDLRGLPILRPPVEIIKAYDSYCNPLFKKNENIAAQIEVLTQLRDALLPRLISGKLRIREAEKLGASAL